MKSERPDLDIRLTESNLNEELLALLLDGTVDVFVTAETPSDRAAVLVERAAVQQDGHLREERCTGDSGSKLTVGVDSDLWQLTRTSYRRIQPLAAEKAECPVWTAECYFLLSS